jgi:hypothetical protein
MHLFKKKLSIHFVIYMTFPHKRNLGLYMGLISTIFQLYRGRQFIGG